MAAVNQTERYTLDDTIMRWKFRAWLEAGLVGKAGSSTAPKDYIPPTAYSAPKSDTDASGAPQVSSDSQYDFVSQLKRKVFYDPVERIEHVLA